MADNKGGAGAQTLPNFWAIMKKYDEGMLEKVTAWRECINKNQILSPKTKQLMMVAMCAVTLNSQGVKNHARFAMEAGATKEELFATAAQSMLLGGVPAYRGAIQALEDIL